MEIQKMNIWDIVPYENNPRKNDAAVDSVAESIRQTGYNAPIIVDEENVVLAGHTRLKALKKLGYTDVDVVVRSGLTAEQKTKFRLLDNKVGEIADWDFNALAAELDMVDFEGFDFGFDSDVTDDGFGEEFSLPDGDKPEICTMTFTLHQSQKELIEYAMQTVKDDVEETFGNGNAQGNRLYEVVRQWSQLRT